MPHKNQITIVLGVEKVLQTEIVKCFVKKYIFYVKIGMAFIQDKTYWKALSARQLTSIPPQEIFRGSSTYMYVCMYACRCVFMHICM